MCLLVANQCRVPSTSKVAVLGPPSGMAPGGRAKALGCCRAGCAVTKVESRLSPQCGFPPSSQRKSPTHGCSSSTAAQLHETARGVGGWLKGAFFAGLNRSPHAQESREHSRDDPGGAPQLRDNRREWGWMIVAWLRITCRSGRRLRRGGGKPRREVQ